MTRTPVQSSNIKSIGYDPSRLMLEVEFVPPKSKPDSSGAVWRYTPVREEIYNELMSAESIGSYFAKNIKPRTTGEKVSG